MEENISTSDNESKLMQVADICDRLSIIIEECNIFYLQNHSPIPLDHFSNIEKNLISQYDQIFLNYAAEKVVLVKWLLDEIYDLFCKLGLKELDISVICNHMSTCFGRNITDIFQESWFKGIKSLDSKQFSEQARIPLEEYTVVTGERPYYMGNLDENNYPNEFSTSTNLKFELNSFFTLRLKSEIHNINQENSNGTIKDLILAYISKTDKRTKLIDLFKGKERVSDINIGLFSNNKQDLLLLPQFLTWLSTDLKSMLYNELNAIFEKHDRDREILCARAKNMTLEEVGTQHGGITRERVRQIEGKYAKKFLSYYSRMRPQHVLSAFSQNKGYVSIKDIDFIYGDLSRFVAYMFMNENFRSLLWVPQLDGFLVDNNEWLEELKAQIDNLPAIVGSDEVESLIVSVLPESPVNADAIKQIILGSIMRTGNVYSKGRLSKKDMYLAVLKKHYPNGIKLYDDFEMLRFRNHIINMFGEVDIPANNRAICARITDVSVLCGNGKYILPSNMKIDDELLERIRSFILDNERNTIAFYEIFDRFKEELAGKTDITNWHYLQGVLRFKYGNEFNFAKDVISKNSDDEKGIQAQIEDYINNQDRVVTNDEIKVKYLGIASYTLGMVIANNKNILIWGFGKYIHASKLIIDNETIERLRNILDEALAKGTVSTRSLFPDVYEREQELIKNNEIENHMALFSLLNYLFSDAYEFSRPFIAQKGTENINLDSVIREYLSQFDEIGVSDLRTYLEDKQIRIMNFSELLENISDEFVRADEDLLVRTSQLQLRRDTFSSIEESLKGIIGMKGYLAAKNVDAFFFFPDIGRRWNPYLLVSLIKRYGQNLKVLKDNIDYRYLTEILIRSDIGVQDYDDLLRYALSHESKRSSFTSIAQVEEFLKMEELISNSIPKNLLEDGTIIPGETRITINLRR